MRRILSRILGVCKVKTNSANAEKLAETVKDCGVSMYPIKFEGEDCSVLIPESLVKRFGKTAESKGIELEITRLFGLPYLYNRYKRRPGILVGAVIFFVLVMMSGDIIWDFEITGNTAVPDTVIIETLEKYGCRAGAFYDDINFDLLQNNCLITADDLAWISVNMDGNLARVEVREKRVVPLEGSPNKGSFANIVAAEDGVIEVARVRNGKVAVEIGDVVKKGELLISGVIDVGEDRVRFENADGEVFAKVYREINAHIPFEFMKTVSTDVKSTEISLKIFGKSIKLSHRGSIDEGFYGKIKEEEKLSLPFGITLPIRMSKTVYFKYSQMPVLLSEDEAIHLALMGLPLRVRQMHPSRPHSSS